jgi:predicted acyltransferase
MMMHTLWRALCLVLLGVFLRSMGQPQTNWTLEDTLTQIGLGYPFLVLLGFRSARVQWIVLVVILVGYWAAWALYPFSNTLANHAVAGVPPDWPHHASGFAAHWNKNANFGAAFDQWFLNLFQRSDPFVANSGGYLTLNFIPTLGTMILGLIAGGWLRNPLAHEVRVRRMVIIGATSVFVGLTLHLIGICPLVKRIWTPSWTIFSGGCCFLVLAAFYALIDWRGWKGWTLPLRVVGMNSIAAYCIAHLFEHFIASSLTTHLGENAFNVFGTAYGPFVRGALILLTFWLLLFWMFRRKIFLKV